MTRLRSTCDADSGQMHDQGPAGLTRRRPATPSSVMADGPVTDLAMRHRHGDGHRTVTNDGTLLDRYDVGRARGDSGVIEKSEVLAAINEYLFDDADATMTKPDVIAVINLYLFGLNQGTHRTGRYRKEGPGCFSGCKC